MKKKKIFLYSVLAIILLIIVIACIVSLSKRERREAEKSPEELATPVEQNYIPSVPEGIKVPEKGTTSTEENVAIPKLQTQAAPGVKAQLRKFSVKGENDAFTPNKIIVYERDTVHIDFLAVDKDYDFSIPAVYGISGKVKKGEEGIIEFQAHQVGQFNIICKICGNKKMGLLIVVPRE